MTRSVVKTHSSSSIGSIKQSMLNEIDFQTIHGTGWVLMDGRGVTAAELGEDSAYYLLTTNANIPDARGQFLRGKNNGRSDGKQNPDGELTLGQYTADAIRNITGELNSATAGNIHGCYDNANGAFEVSDNTAGAPANLAGDNYKNASFSASRVVPTALDNRPKNIIVNIYIKINEV